MFAFGIIKLVPYTFIRKMIFAEAIKGYSQEQQNELNAIFDLWSELSPDLGRDIVNNIRKGEHFLSPEAWVLFLDQILQHGNLLTNDRDKDSYEEEYKLSICFNDIFGTEEVKAKREVIERKFYKKLGSSYDENIFKNNFLKESRDNTFLKLQKIEGITNALLDYIENGEIDKENNITTFAHLRIRPYMMWATWDCDGNSPFSFMKTNDPDEANLCLALGDCKEDEDFKDKFKLLLTYDYRISLYKPTVVDAALHPYFQPPKADFTDYGFTNPHHTNLDALSTRLKDFYGVEKYSREPRPEGLHDPITIQHLIDGSVQKLNYV